MNALKISKIVYCLLVLSGLFLTEKIVSAHFVKPEKGELCQICRMHFTDNPSRAAVIMFKDGKHAKFHGTKCMFTYYMNMEKYDKDYKKKDVATLHVTDYYHLEPIRAEKAFYVIHSSKKGLMGDEIFPFKDIASANKFKKEHGGIVLDYELITPEVISTLNN